MGILVPLPRHSAIPINKGIFTTDFTLRYHLMHRKILTRFLFRIFSRFDFIN